MEEPNSGRAFSYIFVLLTFFAVLWILDRFFGVEYTPEEHRLNKPKEEVKEERPGGTTQGHSVELQETEENKVATGDKKAEKAEATNEKPKKDAEISNGGETEAFFTDLKKKYQREVLSTLPDNRPRTDIVVRYYHHPPDGESAYALQKLKYYIHERPVDPEFEDFQSNAIFYGDSVKLLDIQMVSYTLLKEGLPLKVIKPSKFSSSWKSHAIEIGTDSTLINQPTLTLEEIKNLAI